MGSVARYILKEKIGSGAYGSVHRCIHAKTGHSYACKVLKNVTSDERKKNAHEIGIMQKLNQYPSFVHLVDVVEDKESTCIVQEWCRGGAVNVYAPSVPMSGIVRGVLRGLRTMHENKMIHRDIKPQNVLLVSNVYGPADPDVRICDFGTTIEIDENGTYTDNMLRGTPLFMAPENLLNCTYNFKSDIWSVGVLTHQLLLRGMLPFDDPTMIGIHRLVLSKELLFDDPMWSKVDPNAIDFVRVCLAKDFDQRPSVNEALLHPWLVETGEKMT
jgi:serine/threonine protein kinase